MAGRAVIGRRRHEGQGVAGMGFAAARRRGSGLSPKPVFLQRSGKIGSLLRRSGSSGFERLVPVSSTGCPASTPGLSTWWSSTALDETWF